MQVVLVMFRGEGERRSFSITRDVTVVGRREDCDFRIPLGEISRKHCRIVKDGDVLKVEDLGSSNGTFRNGERVQATELSPGDTLQVGSVAFVVQIDGAPLDDELQPRTAGDRKTAFEIEPEIGSESESDAGHEAEVTLADDSMHNGPATIGVSASDRATSKSKPNGHGTKHGANGHSATGASKVGKSNDGTGSGEFDPMSILEADGSGVLPAIDDSALSDDMMIDIASRGATNDTDSAASDRT